MTESLYSGRPLLNKDTAVCISLAARPSNIGTRFHNYLYNELSLDFIYKAFTTTDIVAAIGGVRARAFAAVRCPCRSKKTSSRWSMSWKSLRA